MGIKIAGRFSFHPAYVSFCYARSFLLIFINLQSSSSTSSVGFRSSIYAFRAFITSVIYSLISLLSMVKYRFTSLNFIIKTSVLLYLLQLYGGFYDHTNVRFICYLASRLLLRSGSSASSPRSPSTSSLSLLSISSKVLSSARRADFVFSSSSCGNGFCDSALAFSS